MSDPETFDPHGTFRADVRASLVCDPMPGLRTLAERVGLPVEQVVHYALYRWMAAGAEALMAAPPQLFEELERAAGDGDLERVRGIAAFLRAGHAGDWT